MPANRLEPANAALRDAEVREFAAFVSLDISRYKRLAEDMGLAEE